MMPNVPAARSCLAVVPIPVSGRMVKLANVYGHSGRGREAARRLRAVRRGGPLSRGPPKWALGQWDDSPAGLVGLGGGRRKPAPPTRRGLGPPVPRPVEGVAIASQPRPRRRGEDGPADVPMVSPRSRAASCSARGRRALVAVFVAGRSSLSPPPPGCGGGPPQDRAAPARGRLHRARTSPIACSSSDRPPQFCLGSRRTGTGAPRPGAGPSKPSGPERLALTCRRRRCPAGRATST